MSNSKKVGYICDDCGSPYVRFDSYATWNPENQRMELDTTFDDCVCGECGREGCIEVNIETYEKALLRKEGV